MEDTKLKSVNLLSNTTSNYDSDEEKAPAVPDRKRRRTTAKPAQTARARKDSKTKIKTRGRQGRLAFILESPMEIVLEILAYLTSVDILHLSYVDKELRAMLMSPSAKSVWVTARRNVDGLPECPPDFTESAYARFLFLKVCEMCGGIARGLNEMPYLRVRLCGRCTKKHCIDGRIARYCLEKYSGCIDLLPRRYPYQDNLSHSRRQTYFRPTTEALFLKMMTMNVDALAVWKRERREFIASVMEHASLLEKWLSRTRGEAIVDSQAVRERRLESICTRLEGLGHDRKDMQSYNFRRHRVVAHSAELTDRAWPNVRRQLEGIVEGNKAARLKRQLRVHNKAHLTILLESKRKALPSTFEKQTFPPVSDLLTLPSMRSLLEIETSSIDASFEAASLTLHEEIEGFRARMRSSLLAMWERYGTTFGRLSIRSGGLYGLFPSINDASAPVLKSDTTGLLNRASTVFCCFDSACHKPLHYTTILCHVDCIPTWLGSAHTDSDDEGENEDSENDAPSRPVPARRYGWTDHLYRLTVKPQSRSTMLTIINAAGLDESTATVDDLDAFGPRFALERADEIGSSNGTWQEAYAQLMADKDFDYDSDSNSDSDSDGSLDSPTFVPRPPLNVRLLPS